MKTAMKSMVTVFIGLTVLALSGCTTSSSDAETEQKIEGSWEATFYETEWEDGTELRMKSVEKVTYELPSHRMHGSIHMRMVQPLSIDFCTMSYEGTWSADKESLTERYDPKTIKFRFHTGLLDAEDKEEMKRDIMSEFESKSVSEIRELSYDRMLLWDGEDELTYKRD